MFEVPGSDIIEVQITEDVVQGTDEAEYIRRPLDSPDLDSFEDEEVAQHQWWQKP